MRQVIIDKVFEACVWYVYGLRKRDSLDTFWVEFWMIVSLTILNTVGPDLKSNNI